MILIEANLPIIISEHVAIRLVARIVSIRLCCGRKRAEYQKAFSPTAQLITIMNNFFSSATKCLRSNFLNFKSTK